MNRTLGRCLLLIALLAEFTLGAEAEETGAAIPRIQSRGELKIGVLATPQFPYAFQQEGSPSGLDIDLAAEIASLLEVQLNVNSSFESPPDLLNALAEGHIDIALSKYKRNLDDALIVRFSAPYSYLNSVLLVNRVRFAALKTGSVPQEVFGRQTVVIGTLGPPRYRQHLADHFPLAQIVSYPTTKLLFEDLLNQTCTAAFVDAAEARGYMADHPELAVWLQYIELPDVSDAVCMAVGWRDSFFAAWLDIFVESSGNLPSLDELFRAYGNEVFNEND